MTFIDIYLHENPVFRQYVDRIRFIYTRARSQVDKTWQCTIYPSKLYSELIIDSS
jgi:hypothetical protein